MVARVFFVKNQHNLFENDDFMTFQTFLGWCKVVLGGLKAFFQAKLTILVSFSVFLEKFKNRPEIG